MLPRSTKACAKNNAVCQQKQLLSQWIKDAQLMAAYLISGTRLIGYIIDFDHYTITWKSAMGANEHPAPFLIYKHRLCSLLPISKAASDAFTIFLPKNNLCNI